jgi:hypothetical protein
VSKRLSLALLAVVFVASGAYCIIYLVRWEWHRALIAGLFFISAQVAMVARMLGNRLRAIETRLDELAASGAEDRQPLQALSPVSVRKRLRETAPPARKPFAWLTRDADQMGVFLPVLLGTGLVASALAWLVEQLARATARPVLERDLAYRLAPIAWPAGGLLGGDDLTVTARRPRRLPKPVKALVCLVLLGGGAVAFDSVEDALETRPDHREDGVQTAIEVRFSGSRLSYGPELVGQDLWASCKIVLGRRTPTPEVAVLDERSVRINLDADIGRYARARLRGCLEDAHIDHLQAGVVSMTSY